MPKFLTKSKFPAEKNLIGKTREGEKRNRREKSSNRNSSKEAARKGEWRRVLEGGRGELWGERQVTSADGTLSSAAASGR